MKILFASPLLAWTGFAAGAYVARNTVYHNADHPSAVEMPVR